MELLVLLATAAFIVAGSTVGVRLLLLARRTRQLPELALGLGFFLVCAVGYPSLLLTRVPGLLEVRPAVALYVVYALVVACGFSSIYVFTWRVFRSTEAWGRLLLGLGIGVLLVQSGGAVRDALGVASADDLTAVMLRWYMVSQVATSGVYWWTGIESFRYWRRQRLRLALGLADPVVADRFKLWTIASASAGLVTLLNTVFLWLGWIGIDHALSRGLIGVGGLVTSVAIYLAFVPPKAYLRAVRARWA